jgi:hypothetical protein
VQDGQTSAISDPGYPISRIKFFQSRFSAAAQSHAITPREPSRDWIASLAAEQGKKVSDLVALASKNDPFYVGSLTDRKQGEWFAALWGQLGFSNGIHLRRIHYRLLDLEGLRKPDGMPYRNMEEDWRFLENASKAARILRLVPAEAFTDRRNPMPQLPSWISMPPKDADADPVRLETPHVRTFYLPSIDTDLDWGLFRLVVPDRPGVYGYESNDYRDRLII